MIQHKIALLTCWYGDYPWFFPYFINSCKSNPTIDFYIITDNRDKIIDKPENVIIVKKSIEQIKNAASKKLGFRVNIDYPYKLCDFKPAYGFLFPEIIKGYDFWGHGDIDIVYGNIRCFITEEFLNSYDIINSRHESIAGSCCLFRNNEQMNTLFMESKDYRKVFSSAEYLGFDECSFLMMALQMGASIFDFPDSIQSMTHLVRNAMLNNKLRAFFDFIIIEGMSNKIKWDNGKIIYKNEFEGLYYNLITYKKKCKNPVVLSPMPDVFYFKKSGITATKRTAKKIQKGKV